MSDSRRQRELQKQQQHQTIAHEEIVQEEIVTDELVDDSQVAVNLLLYLDNNRGIALKFDDSIFKEFN